MTGTVLLAHDDSAELSTIVEVLESSGFAVCAAVGEPAAVVEAMATAPPDICVLRFSEKGVAAKLTGEVRRLLPDVWILVLSGNGSERRFFECLEAGADGYVEEPF